MTRIRSSTSRSAFLHGVAGVCARGLARLDEPMTFSREDLLDYAPVTSSMIDQGRLTLGELAAASIAVSDNTSANLLLKRLGGPGALTHYVRKLSDSLSRASRKLLPGWLRSSETGYSRLRAGPPRSWQVGEKTGTGSNNAANDVAIQVDQPGAGADDQARLTAEVLP